MSEGPRSEFCSQRADLRGDPMLGSAFPAARLLLVEQPGPWGRQGLAESRFGPLGRDVERAANQAGFQVEAIRRPGRSEPKSPLRWAIVDTRPGSESVRWGSYASPEDLLDPADLDGRAEDAGRDVLFLVCTHSKHDPCCAMRGRPVAAALDTLRPGQVFECSHLGGDRFAANVLVLPSGLLYGRVPVSGLDQFVAAAEADEVVSDLLRGRVGLPSAAQAALAFAFEHLELRSRNALTVVASSPVADGLATVRLRGPHHDYEVDVAVETVAADGLTCANPGPNRFLRHRPVTVRSVSR